VSRSFLVFVTFIVAGIVFTYGLTFLIEMIGKLTNTMYSAGHNLGTYLKDIFN